MSTDLDAIEAALVPQYDQYGRGADSWHDNIEMRARLEWLPALIAEVRTLRAVAEAADTYMRGGPDAADAVDALAVALFTWRGGEGK